MASGTENPQQDAEAVVQGGWLSLIFTFPTSALVYNRACNK